MKQTAVVFLMMAFLPFVVGVDRLCVNADNIIHKLYVDGVNYTSRLSHRGNVRHCDCIKVPPNSGVIAIEAENLKQAFGIQECNTAEPALYANWHCRPIERAKSDDWYKPNFDDSGWKPSKGHKCQEHCRQYYQLPCKMSSTKCYWSNKPAKKVRCRLKQCADDCTGCKKAGFGSCDESKCRQGSGINLLNGNTSCNRRCRLEAKAWGRSGEPANGYLQVTDLLTNYVDKWTANTGGLYAATVNMNNCTLTNKNFAVWSKAPALDDMFNKWVNALPGSEYSGVIGVELGVGPNDRAVTGLGSYAPFVAVQDLGLGSANQVYVYDKYHRFKATLKGVQNGHVTVTNIELIP